LPNIVTRLDATPVAAGADGVRAMGVVPLLIAPAVAMLITATIILLTGGATRLVALAHLIAIATQGWAMLNLRRPSTKVPNPARVLDMTGVAMRLCGTALAAATIITAQPPLMVLAAAALLALPFPGATVRAGTHARALDALASQRDKIVMAGKFERIARYDSLTGVENRIAMQARLRSLFETNLQARDAVALLWIDLDRFKEINDSLGHLIGDKLLCQVSEKLCEALDGRGHVARFGGDEFVLICPDADRERAVAIAEDVLAQFRHCFEIETHELNVTTSIGIAIGPQDGRDAEELMRNADIALYEAKREGRDRATLFTWSMKERHNRVRDIEAGLRQAIERNEFSLVFQPIFDLETGAIITCEALLRWNSPTLGTVPPAEFIPIAEKADLIEPITLWVLAGACAEAAHWPDDVRVSVNISAASLRSSDLAREIISILLANNLPARRVELEVTESVFLEDNAHTHQMLRELQLIGLQLVLDDFGTGYSSLSYIRSYRFDILKIDQSFMAGISDSPQDQAIIRAVSGMAEALRMNTVAEGIETEEQLRHARAAQFQRGQGFLLCPPMQGQMLRDIIRRGGSDAAHAALAPVPMEQRKSA